MKEFRYLTEFEQNDVWNKAFTFKHDHVDYVANLLESNPNSVPPSGPDLFHPELWKACHWAWWMELKMKTHELMTKIVNHADFSKLLADVEKWRQEAEAKLSPEQRKKIARLLATEVEVMEDSDETND